MAVHSSHPVSAPPAAPPREKTAHLLLRGWCVAVLILTVGGVAWAHAIGMYAVAALSLLSAVVSAVLWMLQHPDVRYRRLPWLAIAFVAWTGVSIVWSPWPEASAVIWAAVLAALAQGLFIAVALSWRDIVRALASALKWLLTLSLLLELWQATLGGGPTDAGEAGNLFTLRPVQGIFGDRDVLAAVCLLALIVFGVRLAARSPRRGWLTAWTVLAAALFVHAGSATGWLSAAFVALVLSTALLMRSATRPGERTRYYVLFAAAAVALALLTVWLWPGLIVVFGTGELTGGVWPAASVALGPVGVALLALTGLAFVWRAWFFGVDRPRYDLVADRPYSPLALLPTLVGALLLVHSATDAGTLAMWGWLLIVMLTMKIKQVPLVGLGPVEQTQAPEGAPSGTR